MSAYFLAVPLSASVRNALAQIRPPNLPGVKLVHPDKMHLTLHYLGEITTDEIERIATAVSEIDVPSFSVDLKGVGTFPENGKLRVVWAGVEDHPLLNELHKRLGATLTDAIGFQPEDRAFKPHITLARIQRPATREQLADYWEQHLKFHTSRVPVDRFVLYESRFDAGRSVYREIAMWELKKG